MEDKKSKFSILSAKGSRSAVETTAQIIFTICSVVAVAAVFSITLYMIISGTPAIFKVGLLDILFGSVWAPTAATPSYGILYIILTSIVGTALAILIGVPIGIDRSLSCGSCTEKTGSRCKTGGGTSGRHSFGYLRTGRHLDAQSGNVQTGAVSLSKFKNTPVHRRSEPDFSCDRTGDYDPPNGNKYQ